MKYLYIIKTTCLILVTLCLFLSWSSLASSVILRADLNKSSVVVGEQVYLNITIATDSYFTNSADFTLPFLNNALVDKESISYANGTIFVKNIKMSSQKISIQIYPQQVGVITIPEIKFNIYTAIDGYKPYLSKLTTQALTLFVSLPSDKNFTAGLLISPKVDISESWQNSLGIDASKITTLTVGDVVQRKITIKAADSTALILPSPVINNIEGIDTIISEPRLSNHYVRGEHYALLEQDVSYAIQESGEYVLGGEAYHWWSAQEKLLNTYTFKKYAVKSKQSILKLLTHLFLALVLLIFLIKLIVFLFSYLRIKDKWLEIKVLLCASDEIVVRLLYKKFSARHLNNNQYIVSHCLTANNDQYWQQLLNNIYSETTHNKLSVIHRIKLYSALTLQRTKLTNNKR